MGSAIMDLIDFHQYILSATMDLMDFHQYILSATMDLMDFHRYILSATMDLMDFHRYILSATKDLMDSHQDILSATIDLMGFYRYILSATMVFDRFLSIHIVCDNRCERKIHRYILSETIKFLQSHQCILYTKIALTDCHRYMYIYTDIIGNNRMLTLASICFVDDNKFLKLSISFVVENICHKFRSIYVSVCNDNILHSLPSMYIVGRHRFHTLLLIRVVGSNGFGKFPSIYVVAIDLSWCLLVSIDSRRILHCR